VKLKAENAYCNYVDSITVKVSESALYAPNVFSPNGDDVNDEFRFAFKSIVSFQCTIFNRSGKQIYSWTDPLKGWDGTYNGVPVPEGAYFYIATAKGSDNKEYKLKGDINLLRGKKK
jgi:gliding motility-associated-like protein